MHTSACKIDRLSKLPADPMRILPSSAQMAPKPDPAVVFKKSVTDVSSSHDADVIALSGPITTEASEEFVDQIETLCSKPNAFLLLTTNGGVADAAYRIARCLQHTYQDGKIVVFVDTSCKSAGTLITLGANEIVMSELAELGPLDVQLSKSDEIAEMTSGLTPVQALSFLREQAFESLEDYFLKLRFRSGLQITSKTALDIAARLTIGLFDKIYEQMDPMRLGEYQRAMLIAHEYGTRIATENLRGDALNRLIAGYPSHGFIIDREEAGELFNKVRKPEEAEVTMAAFVKPAAQASLKKQDGADIRFLSSANADLKSDERENENGSNLTRTGETSTPPKPSGEPAA